MSGASRSRPGDGRGEPGGSRRQRKQRQALKSSGRRRGRGGGDLGQASRGDGVGGTLSVLGRAGGAGSPAPLTLAARSEPPLCARDGGVAPVGRAGRPCSPPSPNQTDGHSLGACVLMAITDNEQVDKEDGFRQQGERWGQ